MAPTAILNWTAKKIAREIVCHALGMIGDGLMVIPFVRPWGNKLKRYLETKVLLGRWSVKKDGKKYVTEWTFRRDGNAIVEAPVYTHEGEWRFEDDCVRVIWESWIPPENREHCWETLLRPIKATGVRGDSWEGPHCLQAHKLDGAE